MSKVEVYDVHPDILMEWFYHAVMESCGDGAAVICCNNPKETADYFYKWWLIYHRPKMAWRKTDDFLHPRDEYSHGDKYIVNYHDGNENFMFCNKVIDLGHGDISFIIKEQIIPGKDDFVIEKCNE